MWWQHVAVIVYNSHLYSPPNLNGNFDQPRQTHLEQIRTEKWPDGPNLKSKT